MQNGNSEGSIGEDGEKKLVVIATVDEVPEVRADEFIESNAVPGNRNDSRRERPTRVDIHVPSK